MAIRKYGAAYQGSKSKISYGNHEHRSRKSRKGNYSLRTLVRDESNAQTRRRTCFFKRHK